MGMKEHRNRLWTAMAALVLVHFVITIFHGMAHAKANVPLSPVANIFVLAVIVAGPWIGLGLALRAQRMGAGLIALTMAAALIFGCINHFVLASPDHVAHVDPPWRSLFSTTAILLALTEALGSGLAVRSVRARRLR
jgi:hypothetical protein